MALVAQKLAGTVVGPSYVVQVSTQFDTVAGVDVLVYDGDGNVVPPPQFTYPATTPFPGDARTPAQWQAAVDAEAVALVAQALGLAAGGQQTATLTDVTMTELG